jgi:type 2 lantibiotic biosynthesis protein LanM
MNTPPHRVPPCSAPAETEALDDIARRATPLGERTGGGASADAAANRTAADRLSHWCQTIASGDWDAFDKRLAWAGLSRDGAADLLGKVPAVAQRWTPTFARAYGATPAAMCASFDALGDGGDRAVDPESPLPFEELLLPIVLDARARVEAAAEGAHRLVAGEAAAALERSLLLRLTRLCARALYAEFTVYRSCGPRAGTFALFGAALGGGGADLYAAFLGEMRRGRLLAFFHEYPVAARLCAVLADLWVEATAEFLLRLRDDVPDLQRTFSPGSELGPVAAIRADTSDPHDGARSVLILHFGSGLRLVYKPRGIGMEVCFADLLDWIGERGSMLSLKSPRLLARSRYGWIEFIDHAPCGDAAGVSRFYRRCGMLLGVAYALNGSDFHLENLIASGEHPVLIDMEAMLRHHFELVEQLPDHGLTSTAARKKYFESVLAVRMLPTLKTAEDGRCSEMGALAIRPELSGPVRRTGWMGVNTDAMKLGQRLVAPEQGRNIPRLDGEAVGAEAYVTEIVDGFERIYRLLAAHIDELLQPPGLLDRLREQEVRFILRDTNLYATLLERCLHPKYLRDGIDRGIQLDVLCRPLLSLEKRPPTWALLDVERRSLEQMDVPLFSARADSRSIVTSSGEALPGFFRKSAFEATVERLRSLGADDMAFQTELIRGAFRATDADDLRAPADAPARAQPGAAAATLRPTRDAVTYALEVACELRARAVSGPGGEVSWLTTRYLPEARRSELGAASLSLFDGYCGTALFLAALERVTNGAGFRDLALRALQPIRAGLAGFDKVLRHRRRIDIGAGTGVGSAVYALTHIARLLDEPGLLDLAWQLAELVTPEVIAADDAFDVASGTGGAALSLVALHEATEDDRVLARAVTCGTHLLQHRVADPETGLRAWSSRRGGMETGFAHGISGIAFALSRLHAVTGDPAWQAPAAEALALERRMLGPDLAGTAPEHGLAAWSRGAVGLGFARLGMVRSTECCADLDAALRLTRDHLMDGGDDLCCGAAGRVEFLLAAGLDLERSDLVDAAQEGARRILGRTDVCSPGYFDPGLFRGPAGTAYTLLRVLHPEHLPSLLAWRPGRGASPGAERSMFLTR